MLHIAPLIALATAGFGYAVPLADKVGAKVAIDYHRDFTFPNGIVDDAAIVQHNAFVHK